MEFRIQHKYVFISYQALPGEDPEYISELLCLYSNLKYFDLEDQCLRLSKSNEKKGFACYSPASMIVHALKSDTNIFLQT